MQKIHGSLRPVCFQYRCIPQIQSSANTNYYFPVIYQKANPCLKDDMQPKLLILLQTYFQLHFTFLFGLFQIGVVKEWKTSGSEQ